MNKSKLLNKQYNPSNEFTLYISNMYQNYLYLKNGADIYLVDIIWTDSRKENSLVFCYERNEFMKELYCKWNAHELS